MARWPRCFFDAADQFWQDWILELQPSDRQIALASKAQQSGRGE